MSLKPANEGAGGVDLGGSVNAGKAAGATLGANDNCTSHCEAGIVARTASAAMRRRIMSASAQTIVLPFKLPTGKRSGRPTANRAKAQIALILLSGRWPFSGLARLSSNQSCWVCKFSPAAATIFLNRTKALSARATITSIWSNNPNTTPLPLEAGAMQSRHSSQTISDLPRRADQTASCLALSERTRRRIKALSA